MGKYLCRAGKVLLKAFAWILVCSVPTVLFVCSFANTSILARVVAVTFLLNPIYLAIINYRFIRKKNAFFIWLFLVLLQTPWYFPIIFRENNEWFALRILISYIGNYQIIGITICFGITCLVKYLLHRRRAKKALDAVPEVE